MTVFRTSMSNPVFVWLDVWIAVWVAVWVAVWLEPRTEAGGTWPGVVSGPRGSEPTVESSPARRVDAGVSPLHARRRVAAQLAPAGPAYFVARKMLRATACAVQGDLTLGGRP